MAIALCASAVGAQDGDVCVEGEGNVTIVDADRTEGDPIPGPLYSQSAHALPAATVMDADGVNAGGNDIGDVGDLLRHPSGRPHGILFEVGGLLGIGEKTIAVDFSRRPIVPTAEDGWAVMPHATEEEVDAAAPFVTRAEAGDDVEERAEERIEERILGERALRRCRAPPLRCRSRR